MSGERCWKCHLLLAPGDLPYGCCQDCRDELKEDADLSLELERVGELLEEEEDVL